jgi:hypothetical protein
MLKKGDLVRFRHWHLMEMRRLGWRIRDTIMRVVNLTPCETWSRRKKQYSCWAVMDDVTGCPIIAKTSSLAFYARPGKKEKTATQGHGRAITRKLLGLP